MPIRSVLLSVLLTSFASVAASADVTSVPETPPTIKKHTMFKWNNDLDAALKEAKATHKPVVVLLSNPSWCHVCVRLEKQHVNTAAFKAWGADKAIFVKLDKYPKGLAVSGAEKRAYAFGEKYGTNGVPAFVSLDSDGKQLGSAKYADEPTAEFLSDLGKNLKLDPNA